MQDLDDLSLLREYAANHSEIAFEELVSRRVGFVYSAALRQARDPHLAEEITQAVFIILAQKAGRISDKTILTGWLFKTTRFAALAQMRADAKRSLRTATIEKEFQMQSEIQSAATDEIWNQMSPLLDEALASLGETDRQAVLLRFFENKSLAEVGNYLGAGEDTARKRVTRALEKLRKFFTKRGITLSVGVLAGAVSANSVQAAPIGLAITIAATSVKGSAVAASTLTLVKGTLKIMTYAKLKMALGIAAATLFVAGTMTVALSSDGNNSSIGEASAQERTFSAEIMQATKDEDYQTFVADGDRAFKQITELQFKAVCVQITPRLKAGYDLVFLGGLKQHGYHVTLWKVAYPDGGDDELLTLSVKNGKIGGALIH